MTTDTGREVATPSPEEAFSALGDETRLTILQTLGEADGPLAFSELFDRVDYDDPPNFNYHLKKLTGHFVHKTDEGYALRQAGRRVVEAVLAEAQAGETVIERTRVDWPCFLCGEPVEMSYRDGHVGMYCPTCGGTRDRTSSTAVGRSVAATDVLGYLDLPPAGVANRTPEDVLRAASFWTTREALSLAREICPRCSAPLNRSTEVCTEHDAGGDCEACGQRFDVLLHHNCANCLYGVTSPFGTYLLDEPDLIGFMIDHGIDLFSPNGFHLSALIETVQSVDPFAARFTFTADDESLTLTVDEDLSVVDTRRHPASDAER